MRTKSCLIATTVVVLCIMSAMSALATPAPPSFSQTMVLGLDSTLEPNVTEPVVAIDGSTVPNIIYYAANVNGSSASSSIQVWSSIDGGSSFARAGTVPTASGDPAIAVDADGTVYVSSLTTPEPLSVSVSFDHGQTFAATAYPGDSNVSYDREWIVAWGHGNVALIAIANSFSVQAWVSHDHGTTFDGPHTVIPDQPAPVSTEGNIVRGADGALYVIASIDPGLVVARSDDTGLSWTTSAFPLPFNNPAGGQIDPETTYGGTVGLPSIAVDDAGTTYAVWAMHDTKLMSAGASHAYMAVSHDRARTWSTPVLIADPAGSSTFPWIRAGGRGKVDVAYYGSDTAEAPEYASPLTHWDVRMLQSRNADSSTPIWTRTIVSAGVHTGSICSGPLCAVTSADVPTPSNRSFGDLFGMDIDSAGRAVIPYPKDRATDPMNAGALQDLAPDLKVAIQIAGSTIR